MAEIIEERYEVREDGIYGIIVVDTGEDVQEVENLLLPKEVFIEAIDRWCK